MLIILYLLSAKYIYIVQLWFLSLVTKFNCILTNHWFAYDSDQTVKQEL